MHYVCADIHGNWEKYQTMLADLPLASEDNLYILGDVIDRGSRGIAILRDIMNRKNISFFLGNHELFLLGCVRYGLVEWMDSWLQNGGQASVEEFLKLSSREQDEVLSFLEDAYVAMPDLVVGEKHYYLVHAYPNTHYMEQPVRFSEMKTAPERIWRMVWERLHDVAWEENYVLQTIREDGRILLLGHTITTMFCRSACDEKGRARIYHGPFFTDLDCGCGRQDDRACLGVLRLEDGMEYYY